MKLQRRYTFTDMTRVTMDFEMLLTLQWIYKDIHDTLTTYENRIIFITKHL